MPPYEEKVGNDACLTCSRVNLRANFVIPTQLSSPLLLQMRNTNRRHVYIIAPLLENIGRCFYLPTKTNILAVGKTSTAN